MSQVLEVYNLNPVNGEYTRIGEITTYMDLEWNQKSNKPSTLTFGLNVYSSDTTFIQPFKNWILIKRDGVPYLFNIISVRGSMREGSQLLNIVCADIHYVLNQIYVEGSYISTNTDAGTIAVALINLAQAKTNANYGIQFGTIGTIGSTNETLYYQSIGAALTNQSDNIVGYNFSFTPVLDTDDKLDYIRFDCLKSMGSYKNNLPPLELGYSVNVVDFGMAGEVYNKVYTLGTGTGDTLVTQSENTGSGEIFGLREKVNKEPTITTRESLQSKGDSFLSSSQGIKLELAFQLTEGIKPYYGDFGLLDTLDVNVKITNTFFNFQGTAQVKEIIFNYDHQTNKETITPIIEYFK